MNATGKKIEAAARIEGEVSTLYIKCDLDESRDRPIAVLFWPSSSDSRKVHYPVEPTELSPSDTEGVAYIYTGEPLHIPKALAEIERSADPLSPDRLRLGFCFLPENPSV